MTALAPLLQAFFADRLPRQRYASPHDRRLPRQLPAAVDVRARADRQATIEAAARGSGRGDDRGVPRLPGDERGNSVRTRNARLTAIHSFFRYAALEAPDQAQLIARVLGIPEKRFDTTLISYLDEPEINALLASPDRSTWTGRVTTPSYSWRYRPVFEPPSSRASAAKTSSSAPPGG